MIITSKILFVSFITQVNVQQTGYQFMGATNKMAQAGQTADAARFIRLCSLPEQTSLFIFSGF
jgi:hypothetical protein